MFRPRTAALAAVISVTALSAMPTPTVSVVTTGQARSFGEPAAAKDASVSAVVATSFGAAGARALVWTRRAGSRNWRQAGAMLPAGFGTSYDASAASRPGEGSRPGGALLLAAGMAPPGSCIANGSVGIADVYPDGRVSATRLVSDQRGTGSFDDRPAIAAAAGGLVWVAWSQGRNADACQDVGQDDRLTVAVSHDGGATFGRPLTMPAMGGHAAFGARLAPLAGGRVAVSWTETMPGGDEAVLVAVLGPGRQVSMPRIVLRGAALPQVLPGASFFDFPAGAITALAGGTLVVAAPLWRAGRSVVAVSAGAADGGLWHSGVISPPRGADLLLPALGRLGTAGVVLLCAVHYRAGDRLGYAAARLAAGTLSGHLSALTAAPSGPGFFEIGEEGSMTATPSGLIASVVVAGKDGAAVETVSWTAPPTVATPSHTSSAQSGKRGPGGGKPAADRAGKPGGLPVWLAWLAAALAVLLASAAAWAVVRWRGRASMP